MTSSTGSNFIDDPYHLERFVEAQAEDYDAALTEIRAGRKRSHWMWYIFPQLEGLGTSSMARRYAIRSVDEARAYLQHPVLGARLRECAAAFLAHRGHSANEILGSPDDLKMRSCATLFAHASGEPVFRDILEHFYDGIPDPRTEYLLGSAPSGGSGQE